MVRLEPAASGRPAAPGGSVRIPSPTAAALHAIRARRRTRRISHRTGRIIAVPILAPLPNIAVHVIQSPGIGPFGCHSMGILLSNIKRIVSIPVSTLPNTPFTGSRLGTRNNGLRASTFSLQCRGCERGQLLEFPNKSNMMPLSFRG